MKLTVNDKMKEMFEFEAIQAAPVHSLAECVAAAEERRQKDASDDIGNGTNPIEEIKERFCSSLYLCNERERAFLALAAGTTEKKAAWAEEVNYYPYRVFAHNDFVYLFLWDEQYYLVLPDELLVIYNEVTSEASFPATNAQKLEMTDYANALLNLYGAYEIEWFVTVWNHHHKDKITMEEAEEFLSDRAYFNSDFYFYDWFIVHDCMDEDEFEALWEKTEELDYYMPTKSVIREYRGKGYDDSKIPGEREMENFLAEYIQEERLLENVLFEIKESCERLKLPADIRESLADAAAPLDDEIFREKFERLYNNLRDNTHVWELKGFTPYQYQMETGEAIRRFQLPKDTRRKKK